MKIVCIKSWDDYLTIGKIYYVVEKTTDGYFIINDMNKGRYWYPKDWFESKSEIRNDKIDKLLGE